MSTKTDVLQKIVRHKQLEIKQRSERDPFDVLQARVADMSPCRGFIESLQTSIVAGKDAVIAEIKKASPSKGVIRGDFQPVEIAQSYQRGGATCLSVLTDEEFFQGHDDYLQQVREVVTLPILRKDFILTPYQVYETRSLGADCLLLITAILDDQQLAELYHLASELGLDVLLEAHNEEELQRALTLQPRMIGINNRDLKTFTTSIDTTIKLRKQVPEDCIVITESGIQRKADVKHLREYDIHAFLVGEGLMKAEDPGQQLRELFIVG